MPAKRYDLFESPNCARFVYNSINRVVRVVAIEKGNVTGYETRKGNKIVNVRYAKIKSFKISRMENGTLVLSDN